MSRKASSFLVGILAGAAATIMLPRILKKLQESSSPAQLKPVKAKPTRTPKRTLIAKADTAPTRTVRKKQKTTT